MSQADGKPKVTRKQLFAAIKRAMGWGYAAAPKAFLTMFIGLIVVSILPFIDSYVNSKVIDEVILLLGIDSAQRNIGTLATFVVLAIIAAIIQHTLWVIISYAEKVFYFGISRFAVVQFLDKSSQLDMYHYESPETNSIIQKARDVYDWRPREFISRSVWMIGDVVKIITSIGVILSFSIPAFLLIIATTLPSLIVNYKLGEGSWGIWDANANDRRRYGWSRDLLSRDNSIVEVRIFKTREYLMNMITGIYDQFTNKEKNNQVKRTVLESIVGNLSIVGTLIFWVLAIKATLDGNITIGLLAFYTGAVERFSNSLSNLFRSVSNQYESALYLVDLFKFMDLKNVIVSGKKKPQSKIEPPVIEFQDVAFHYPGSDRLVLNGFNLKINPGEKVALVGINGAGKTTIIKLLCRFYDVTEGRILIDGVDIRELNLEEWYKKIGVLFQNFVRYGQFSVRTNVELGDAERIGEEKAFIDSLFKADAQKFVDEYEHKSEQILDKSFEKGITPSGGQWQKIALARAFFRNAPILILDEPTAAIDAKAEYDIFQRLYEFSAGKSVIIISHRFSTVRNADRIYVVDDGKVIEEGTHQELVKLKGKYFEAFDTQAQGYK